jgi:CelD/BcsL family acetyltransferase involved in cellulose biosynthesis
VSSAFTASLIEDSSELEPLRESWDRLAVSARAPFGAPAWTLAWWRHLAPADARLAVVAVAEGRELVGLAPFFARRRFGVAELRLLGGGFASRLGILAAPGREPEVAAAMAEALAGAQPAPDTFRWEALDAESPWPGLLSAAWPGREHLIREEARRGGPVLALTESSYEDWLAGKSRDFRRKVRRRRRNLEAEGASFRLADRASLRRDLDSFARLHHARWADRGGSSVPVAATSMLAEAGESLIDSGRFRLWMIDGPDGEAISAKVLVAAGGVVAAWARGFDEGWSRHAPGILATHVAIEDAFERGDDLYDMGGGEADDKQQFAGEDRPVVWRTSYPRGPRYPLARLSGLPENAARRGSVPLRRWLGPERVNRLRGLLRR